MPFAVGDVVAARYEVQASLGQRPLGWLYRAREREIGVEVALRVIGGEVLPDQPARHAFVQRIMRSRAFSHPNLVRVFGVYPTAEDVVIATQWAPGETLYERVIRQPLTVDEARPLVAQAAAAITHAHQHGVVLGDVHAATVVLLGGVLKVSNVGIGPALPRKRFLEAVRDTPGHQRLPPEVRNGLAADTRADVYSLAMLLVEMLTAGADAKGAGLLDGHKPLATVLGRALADDPLVRHASVDALAHELDAVLGGQPQRPRRTNTLPPMGVMAPTRERSDPHRVVAESTARTPPPDHLGASDETTRSMPESEIELLKGDQITRQVPLAEIFELRVASSDTHDLEDGELLEEVETDEAEELALEAPPAGADEGRENSGALLMESDSVTIQVPRLVDNNSPPPLDDGEVVEMEAQLPRRPTDDLDTRRVKKVPQELIDATATPLPPPLSMSTAPPPMPSAPLVPPGPSPSAPIPPAPSLTPLAEARDVPTRVEVREPKIEINELPILQGTPPQGSPPPPAAALPSVEIPLYGPEDEERPTTSGHVAAPLPEVPSTPRKRRNPFEPLPEAETAPGKVAAVQAAVGESTVDGRKPKPPQGPPTQLVGPIGRRPSLGSIALVAAVAFVAAVGLALAVSRWLQAQRLQEERRNKQRMAEELNARNEPLRLPPGRDGLKASVAPGGTSAAPSGTAAGASGTSAATNGTSAAPSGTSAAPPSGTSAAASQPTSQPLDTVLLRSGPCPLGAKLVPAPHAFCIDAYEYPGGNTIPRVSVDFAEASHICAARGERLCADSEWERACRGKNGASFPYGSSYDATRCNTKGPTGEVAPAGAFANCRSAVGAYDMSGNVAEWVASGAQRGGAVSTAPALARCSAVVRNPSREGGVHVGFRCCADPL